MARAQTPGRQSRHTPPLAITAALLLSACAGIQSAAISTVAALTPSVEGAAIVAGPPGAESTAQELRVVQGPWSEERRALALYDDEFDPFHAFAPALGERFIAENYPLTGAALQRVRTPLGASVLQAKERFARARPFVADASVQTCITPDERLRASGAYPSGHAAFGWAWGLVLAELDPTHADAILARAREYGDSRVVCGLHYPSDVEAGRTLAAAALARLHAEPEFRAALEAARFEFSR
jgi:acid phosphatase (class A)